LKLIYLYKQTFSSLGVEIARPLHGGRELHDVASLEGVPGSGARDQGIGGRRGVEVDLGAQGLYEGNPGLEVPRLAWLRQAEILGTDAEADIPAAIGHKAPGVGRGHGKGEGALVDDEAALGLDQPSGEEIHGRRAYEAADELIGGLVIEA